MKIGIMQPYFFPYLGYWQLLNAVDKYVIYDDVNYIKNGWINRNNILLNGKPHLLTIPLDGASPFSLIKDIKTTSNLKLKEKLLKTLEMAYKKAPCFDDVFPIISQSIMAPMICQGAVYALKKICEYLDLETELLLSSEMKKDNSLKGQDKVLHICKLLGATDYYNAIGGQELYDKTEFEQQGIKLSFMKMKPVSYQQYKNEFVPNLSMIDILMFNYPQEIKELLNEFELV